MSGVDVETAVPRGGDQRGASTPVEATPTATRIAGIEALRGIAASAILVYHVWLYTWLYTDPGGRSVDVGPANTVLPHLPLGVTLFFTLSGFLLYLPFARRILAGRPLPSLATYARNRALRIAPAYWVVFLVSGTVLGALLVRDGDVLRFGGFASDPALLPLGLPLLHNYDPARVLSGVGPTWSLTIEVAFYATLPLLAVAAARAARPATTVTRRYAAALLPAAVLLGTGIAGKVAVWTLHRTGSGPVAPRDGSWLTVLEKSILGQADLFAFGLALAVVVAAVERGTVAVRRWWAAAAMATAGLLAVGLDRFGTPELFQRGEASHYAYQSIAALACALVLAAVVLPTGERPGAGRRLLESPALRSLGLVSYGVFLWHEPIVNWLARHDLLASGRRGLAVNLVVVASTTLVTSALTYRFVEAPMLRRKRHMARSH